MLLLAGSSSMSDDGAYGRAAPLPLPRLLLLALLKLLRMTRRMQRQSLVMKRGMRRACWKGGKGGRGRDGGIDDMRGRMRFDESRAG